jgi:hypothetical protein
MITQPAPNEINEKGNAHSGELGANNEVGQLKALNVKTALFCTVDSSHHEGN